MDVFVSWSGGKDCTLACYRAMKAGHNVKFLASMVTEEMGRLYPHHLTPEVLKRQAEALGLPLKLVWTKSSAYNETFIEMLKEFKEQGIGAGVFGDVSLGNPDVDRHLGWINQVCKAAGIDDVILPLWNEDRSHIISDLISLGFKTMIIAADDNKLGTRWVGRWLDWEALAELKDMHARSRNGEVGLYHTLTLDGPIFKKQLNITESEIVFRESGLFDGKPAKCPFWYLDIRECRLEDKRACVPAE